MRSSDGSTCRRRRKTFDCQSRKPDRPNPFVARRHQRHPRTASLNGWAATTLRPNPPLRREVRSRNRYRNFPNRFSKRWTIPRVFRMPSSIRCAASVTVTGNSIARSFVSARTSTTRPCCHGSMVNARRGPLRASISSPASSGATDCRRDISRPSFRIRRDRSTVMTLVISVLPSGGDWPGICRTILAVCRFPSARKSSTGCGVSSSPVPPTIAATRRRPASNAMPSGFPASPMAEHPCLLGRRP